MFSDAGSIPAASTKLIVLNQLVVILTVLWVTFYPMIVPIFSQIAFVNIHNFFQNNHQPIGIKPESKPIYPFVGKEHFKIS